MNRPFGNSREADGLSDGLQMDSKVAPVETGGEDALVEQMQRMLFAVADGADDLMATSRDT